MHSICSQNRAGSAPITGEQALARGPAAGQAAGPRMKSRAAIVRFVSGGAELPTPKWNTQLLEA